MQIFRFSEKTAEQSESMQTERSKIFFLFAVNEMLNLSINRLQLFLSMDKCSHYEHHIKRNRF